MKRIYISAFLCLQSLLFLNAQLLWEISGKNLQHPSYLFGTYNLVSLDHLNDVTDLFKTFDKCETVIGETVLSKVDAMSKIQSAAIMPDNLTMNDLLSLEDFAAVDAELRRVLKIELKKMNSLNPGLITTLYKTELYKQHMKLPQESQMDSYFQITGAEQGKSIEGLESLEEQISYLFNNDKNKYKARLLVDIVENKDSVVEKMRLTSLYYEKGQLDYFLKTMMHPISINDSSEMEYKQMLAHRNPVWMNKIISSIQNSSCFIPVNAIYLPGDSGLIKLLQKEGYRVRPVQSKAVVRDK